MRSKKRSRAGSTHPLAPKQRLPWNLGSIRNRSPRLTQEFLQRLPIINLPALRKVFRIALGKSSMLKHYPCPRALFYQLKSRNRVISWIPSTCSPRLDDSFVRHKFQLSSRDVPAEKRKRPTRFTADLRSLGSRCHVGLHSGAKLHYFLELFRVR